MATIWIDLPIALLSIAGRVPAPGIPPMSTEEIDAQVMAARAKARRPKCRGWPRSRKRQ